MGGNVRRGFEGADDASRHYRPGPARGQSPRNTPRSASPRSRKARRTGGRRHDDRGGNRRHEVEEDSSAVAAEAAAAAAAAAAAGDEAKPEWLTGQWEEAAKGGGDAAAATSVGGAAGSAREQYEAATASAAAAPALPASLLRPRSRELRWGDAAVLTRRKKTAAGAGKMLSMFQNVGVAAAAASAASSPSPSPKGSRRSGASVSVPDDDDTPRGGLRRAQRAAAIPPQYSKRSSAQPPAADAASAAAASQATLFALPSSPTASEGSTEPQADAAAEAPELEGGPSEADGAAADAAAAEWQHDFCTAADCLEEHVASGDATLQQLHDFLLSAHATPDAFQGRHEAALWRQKDTGALVPLRGTAGPAAAATVATATATAEDSPCASPRPAPSEGQALRLGESREAAVAGATAAGFADAGVSTAWSVPYLKASAHQGQLNSVAYYQIGGTKFAVPVAADSCDERPARCPRAASGRAQLQATVLTGSDAAAATPVAPATAASPPQPHNKGSRGGELPESDTSPHGGCPSPVAIQRRIERFVNTSLRKAEDGGYYHSFCLPADPFCHSAPAASASALRPPTGVVPPPPSPRYAAAPISLVASEVLCGGGGGGAVAPTTLPLPDVRVDGGLEGGDEREGEGACSRVFDFLSHTVVRRRGGHAATRVSAAEDVLCCTISELGKLNAWRRLAVDPAYALLVTQLLVTRHLKAVRFEAREEAGGGGEWAGECRLTFGATPAAAAAGAGRPERPVTPSVAVRGPSCAAVTDEVSGRRRERAALLAAACEQTLNDVMEHSYRLRTRAAAAAAAGGAAEGSTEQEGLGPKKKSLCQLHRWSRGVIFAPEAGSKLATAGARAMFAAAVAARKFAAAAADAEADVADDAEKDAPPPPPLPFNAPQPYRFLEDTLVTQHPRLLAGARHWKTLLRNGGGDSGGGVQDGVRREAFVKIVAATYSLLLPSTDGLIGRSFAAEDWNEAAGAAAAVPLDAFCASLVKLAVSFTHDLADLGGAKLYTARGRLVADDSPPGDVLPDAAQATKGAEDVAEPPPRLVRPLRTSITLLEEAHTLLRVCRDKLVAQHRKDFASSGGKRAVGATGLASPPPPTGTAAAVAGCSGAVQLSPSSVHVQAQTAAGGRAARLPHAVPRHALPPRAAGRTSAAAVSAVPHPQLASFNVAGESMRLVSAAATGAAAAAEVAADDACECSIVHEVPTASLPSRDGSVPLRTAAAGAPATGATVGGSDAAPPPPTRASEEGVGGEGVRCAADAASETWSDDLVAAGDEAETEAEADAQLESSSLLSSPPLVAAPAEAMNGMLAPGSKRRVAGRLLRSGNVSKKDKAHMIVQLRRTETTHAQIATTYQKHKRSKTKVQAAQSKQQHALSATSSGAAAAAITAPGAEPTCLILDCSPYLCGQGATVPPPKAAPASRTPRNPRVASPAVTPAAAPAAGALAISIEGDRLSLPADEASPLYHKEKAHAAVVEELVASYFGPRNNGAAAVAAAAAPRPKRATSAQAASCLKRTSAAADARRQEVAAAAAAAAPPQPPSSSEAYPPPPSPLSPFGADNDAGLALLRRPLSAGGDAHEAGSGTAARSPTYGYSALKATQYCTGYASTNHMVPRPAYAAQILTLCAGISAAGGSVVRLGGDAAAAPQGAPRPGAPIQLAQLKKVGAAAAAAAASAAAQAPREKAPKAKAATSPPAPVRTKGDSVAAITSTAAPPVVRRMKQLVNVEYCDRGLLEKAMRKRTVLVGLKEKDIPASQVTDRLLSRKKQTLEATLQRCRQRVELALDSAYHELVASPGDVKAAQQHSLVHRLRTGTETNFALC